MLFRSREYHTFDSQANKYSLKCSNNELDSFYALEVWIRVISYEPIPRNAIKGRIAYKCCFQWWPLRNQQSFHQVQWRQPLFGVFPMTNKWHNQTNQNNIASKLWQFCFAHYSYLCFFDSFFKCWIIINSSSIVTSIKLDSSLQVHCWYSNLEQKRSLCEYYRTMQM